jgi:hypothetical protein
MFASKKTNEPKQIAKMVYGYLVLREEGYMVLREEKLSFNKNY